MALNRTGDGADALVYIVDIKDKKVIDIVKYKDYKVNDSKQYWFLNNNTTIARFFPSVRGLLE